jgi:hypothetical protein
MPMVQTKNTLSEKYSVSVGNYLKNIINATVNVTDSTPSGYAFGNINDKTNSTTEFQSNINGTINITLTYTISGSNVTEKIPVNVTTMNSTVGFFDITLMEKDMTVRRKQIYNWTWSK